MAIIEESININRPVDKVFAYTLDVKSWPKWQTSVTEPEQTSQGQIGIGTTFKWTIHAMGMTAKTTAKITEYEPNKRWSKTENTPSASTVANLSFDPIAGGTKFTLHYDIELSGFLKLLSPMLVSANRKSLKAALNKLKSILEAQP